MLLKELDSDWVELLIAGSWSETVSTGLHGAGIPNSGHELPICVLEGEQEKSTLD